MMRKERESKWVYTRFHADGARHEVVLPHLREQDKVGGEGGINGLIVGRWVIEEKERWRASGKGKHIVCVCVVVDGEREKGERRHDEEKKNKEEIGKMQKG
jgi:hypothetical protein